MTSLTVPVPIGVLLSLLGLASAARAAAADGDQASETDTLRELTAELVTRVRPLVDAVDPPIRSNVGPAVDEPALAATVFPTRADEVPVDATVGELVDAYQRHLLVTVLRDRPGQPLTADEQVARHAVAALALGQAVADTFAAERWPLVRRELAFGATLDDVGAALGGLEVDEVTAELASWADREHRAGALDDAAYEAVLALVAPDAAG